MNTNKENKRKWAKTFRLTGRFVPYYKPYWKEFSLDLLCATFTCVCELILPLIVRSFTDTALNDMARLTVSRILLVGGLYIILRLLDTAASYFKTAQGHIMGAKIETDLRRDMFSHLQKLSYAYYDNAKIGQLMSRITTDLNDVTEFAHHLPEEIFIAVIKVGVSFIILLPINPVLTMLVYLMIPVMAYCASRFNLYVRNAFRASRMQLGELNAHVEDSLLGIRVVKAFANEEIESEKFEQGNQFFLQIKKNVFRGLAAFHSTTRLFDGLMYVMVLIVGSLFMRTGAITAPDMVAYMLYVSMLLAAVSRMVEFMEQFQRGITGLERFTEIMDEPIEIHDNPGATDIENVRGDIVFDHVSFAYSDGDTNVLTDINLHVSAGQSIALVGPSGGGKTTLCSLLPRFYEVTDGRILLDGKDIRELTLHSLRSNIGVVQQDVYLFSGSIAQNIEYGKPGATREEVIGAAKMAGAHEFITQLEQGYDTYVGERGTKLSGGQKQRVAIARVFLKNPPVLILDEATSALDNESEFVVQQSLEALMRGRTTFTIAHRLSTIRNADCILVLTDEGIVEQGNHIQLTENKGVYYALGNLYAQGVTEADG